MINPNWRNHYYLGFDLGVASVGWTVTDSGYFIPKLRGERLWGVRLFSEANTAESRRTARSSRRRLSRAKERVKYLNDIFTKELNAVDPDFLGRLKDSFFYPDDKQGNNKGSKFTLFNDSNYSDKDYHRAYPTIWHLRNALINGEGLIDIRLYYLAIAHIVKNRGNFLYQGNFNKLPDFATLWADFVDAAEQVGIYIQDDSEIARQILSDSTISSSDKKKALKQLVALDKFYGNDNITDKELTKKQSENLLGLLNGGVAKVDSFFNIDSEDDIKATFKGEFEELLAGLSNTLTPIQIDVLRLGRQIFDYSVLVGILKDNDYLSGAITQLYQKHGNDRKLLREVLNDYWPSPILVKAFFEGSGKARGKKERFLDVDKSLASFEQGNDEIIYVAKKGDALKKKATYLSFVKGCTAVNGGRVKHNHEYFVQTVQKILDPHKQDSRVQKILDDCDNGLFLPVQRGQFSGVIPMQLHRAELEIIMQKLAHSYPSFTEVDQDGYSSIQKIKSLLEFKLPYYVGPTNTKSPFSWLKDARKPGKITPWNWQEKIDQQKAAEYFIDSLTANCSYLFGETVLPKSSFAYQKYEVLNILNKMRIDQNPISVDLKQRIYEGLFVEVSSKITKKKIKDFLVAIGAADSATEISIGDADDDGERPIPAQLSSYQTFKNILGVDYRTDLVDLYEQAITALTSLPDNKAMVVSALEKVFRSQLDSGDISAAQIQKLSSKAFTGWGKLSNKLLQDIRADIHDPQTGEWFESVTILEAMWVTNLNFMQTIHDPGFKDAMLVANRETRKRYDADNLSWQGLVEDSYASPPVKRSLTQAFRILDELVKEIGAFPKRIFVETTRSEDKTKKRTESRYKQLDVLYKNLKKDNLQIANELSLYKSNEGALKSKALYLYFTQMGKCPYCAKPININEIHDRKIYDIDHIIPQSIIKDDSFDNLVVACRRCNASKTDKYPLPAHNRNQHLYEIWYKAKLISKSKYERLMRPESRPLTPDDLADFVARQLVETSQTSRLFTEILRIIYPDVQVVMTRANMVSDFRRGSDDSKAELKRPEFYKLRALNDYHHAKDAYLNVVVGNVLYEKFTGNPKKWFIDRRDKGAAGKGFGYHLSNFFDRTVWNANGEIIWNQELADRVAHHMERNDILWTRMTEIKHGAFYNQQIVSKAANKYPIKSTDARLSNTARYGGYDSLESAYIALIDIYKQNKIERKLVYVPVLHAHRHVSYLKEFYQTNADRVQVILPRIPLQSLLRINGFPVHITGANKDGLELISAVQFVLTNTTIRSIDKDGVEVDIDALHYLRTLIRLVESDENKTEANAKRLGVNFVGNNSLLQLLSERVNSGLYRNRPKPLPTIPAEFVSDSAIEQAETIVALIRVLACNPDRKKLSALGISSEIGRMKQVKLGAKGTKDTGIINSKQQVKLIYQSVTGLRETVVDLWEILPAETEQ